MIPRILLALALLFQPQSLRVGPSKRVGPTMRAGGPVGTTSRIFNGTSDFLKSTATVDLSTFKQISGMLWLNRTFANDDQLAVELSANYGSCGVVNPDICFLVDPNFTSGTFLLGLHNSAGFQNCTFARPSSGFHKYAWAFDTSVNPNTCAAWVDGASVTTTFTGSTITTETFKNETIYLMSRAGTSLFGSGTISRFALFGGHIFTGSEGNNLTSASGCTDPLTIAGVIVYLPFNGVSPETDAAGGGHNFIVTGTTTGTQTCP